jgi:hypothetical protein
MSVPGAMGGDQTKMVTGGKTSLKNARVMCQRCNSIKGAG